MGVILRLFRGGEPDGATAERETKALCRGEVASCSHVDADHDRARRNAVGADPAAARLTSRPRTDARREMAQALRTAMAARAVSAADVAAALDVTRHHLGDLLASTKPFETGHLAMLCDRLGLVAVEVILHLARRLRPDAKKELLRRLGDDA